MDIYDDKPMYVCEIVTIRQDNESINLSSLVNPVVLRMLSGCSGDTSF